MRIGVLSDTHGSTGMAERAVKKMKGVNTILHGGDLVTDAQYIAKLKYRVHYVKGNCDYYSSESTEKIIKIGTKKILLTHGHNYGVKSGYDNLLERAKQLLADIVVFGHTHFPEKVYIDNVLFFNPGSTTFPKGGGSGTFGILEITKENVNAQIHML